MMDDATLYLRHREAADEQWQAGNGELCLWHAGEAHAALIRYATAHGLTTDAAAAHIRRQQKANRTTLSEEDKEND